MERVSVQGREKVIETLKAELRYGGIVEAERVKYFQTCRHLRWVACGTQAFWVSFPNVYYWDDDNISNRTEMVEPLEETRSELIFATEPLLFSLYLATPNSPRATSSIELDEVEVRLFILILDCSSILSLKISH